jgi:hypothetical protein
MTLRLNGSTSGYTEIDAPAVAGSNTLVLPTGNGSADQALVTNGSGTLSFADRGRMVLETAKASTSGTAVDFTGIPNWVKRITVMFSGVSTNGTSNVRLQIGTSSGVETSGYLSASSTIVAAVATVASTAGFDFWEPGSAASVRHGQIAICLLGSNTWTVGGGIIYSDSARTCTLYGSKALSGTLDRVRITTAGGTDTFDAGSINILYEG